MKRLMVSFILSFVFIQLIAQDPVTVKHSMTVAGKKIDYSTQTGYLDLKNDTGKLIAKVFFTYYKKEGEEPGKRPVTFTFNGGPGSASVWLHMGGLAPKRVALSDDGTAPAPPYSFGIKRIHLA